MPPFVDHIVKIKLGELRETDLRAGADECAIAPGSDVFFGGDGKTQGRITDEQSGVRRGQHGCEIGSDFGKFGRNEPACVAKNSGEGLCAAGTLIERDAAGFSDGGFRNDQQAADTFLGSDGKIGKDDEIWNALQFDGGNDGDIRCASAEGLGAQRRNRERKIVLALQRAVRETAHQWRGVEILHDGDAKFAHRGSGGRAIIAEPIIIRSSA